MPVQNPGIFRHVIPIDQLIRNHARPWPPFGALEPLVAPPHFGRVGGPSYARFHLAADIVSP
jgi:hypothetical protein